MSFDIDDEDREHYYRQYGKPDPTARLPRRSRTLQWLGISTVVLLFLYFLSRPRKEEVDWSRFAYSLYATDGHTLCNAFMIFEALHRLGSKADRVLSYPEQWDTVVHNSKDRTSQLLENAKRLYKVELNPVQLIGAEGAVPPGTLDAEASWDTSITKLLAFELTYYDRILHLDGDITLLQNLDDLFLLPPTPIAMPRAYWADVPPATVEGARAWPLTSLLILFEPNTRELKYMLDTLKHWRMAPEKNKTQGKYDRYDMNILNHRFGDSAMVLPHRPYALLSAEFRRDNHSAYLGVPDSLAHWDAEAVYKEAKLVHFSDWPLPKPWVMWPPEGLAEVQPKCHDGKETCPEKKIWKGLYEDFRRRRKDHCRILSVPAPKWEDWKKDHGAG